MGETALKVEFSHGQGRGAALGRRLAIHLVGRFHEPFLLLAGLELRTVLRPERRKKFAALQSWQYCQGWHNTESMSSTLGFPLSLALSLQGRGNIPAGLSLQRNLVVYVQPIAVGVLTNHNILCQEGTSCVVGLFGKNTRDGWTAS
jgi:hypothetical protein